MGIMMLFVKDTPRKTVNTQAPKQSFIEIITLLFKVLRTSRSLVLTIIAGTIYHVLLGASVFDQVWAIQDKGLDRATFAQASGWIFTIFGLLGSVFGGTFSDWAQSLNVPPKTLPKRPNIVNIQPEA